MNDLVRKDFQTEGEHQWVAHKGGYRIVVRRYDGGYEIVIREELTRDPLELDWFEALQTVNQFYQQLRLAEERDYRHEDTK